MPDPIATSTIARQAARLMEMSDLAAYGEGTELSKALTEQYPVALDALLEGFDWSFASTLADLPAATAPVQDAEFPYSFKLPADCVRLIAVKPATVDWRADDEFIRADQTGPLRIRYTRRTDQEARLPALFKKAVAAELAFSLAPQFLRTSRRVAELEKRAERDLKKAMRAFTRQASSERYDGLAEQDDWVCEAAR